ncbi:hypothetical protein IF2G_07181 [Cordyceps javanica]|nr:hypothetical protein IF2G_07181 [Cordyceps javanica]
MDAAFKWRLVTCLPQVYQLPDGTELLAAKKGSGFNRSVGSKGYQAGKAKLVDSSTWLNVNRSGSQRAGP